MSEEIMYYRKVMCSDRPPEKNGSYDTSLGRQFFSSVSGWGLPYRGKWEYPKDNTNPEWWLEEIELPSEENKQAIVKEWYKDQQFKSNYPAQPSSFMAGFNKAIELIKGK